MANPGVEERGGGVSLGIICVNRRKSEVRRRLKMQQWPRKTRCRYQGSAVAFLPSDSSLGPETFHFYVNAPSTAVKRTSEFMLIIDIVQERLS